MIDFTNCIKNYKYYSGADRKISIHIIVKIIC